MSRFAQYLAARVPRYTSYPTAPHFHAGVDATTYRAWLQNLPGGTPLSLYLHIPFCDTLCWFCGCHTTVVNRYAPVGAYLDLLLRERDLVAEALPEELPVTHMHWGGGSPTMLSPGDILRVAAAMRERLHFAPGAEFAIEIDPRGFKEEMADALAAAGLTRASIGVQDCDATVQRAINRFQPMETTARAVELLRERGIQSLNIDLIYGLPHQTTQGLERTIRFALSLAPQRLAIFGYAHVPHFKKHQNLIAISALPDFEARFEQAQAAQALLSAAGYLPIGLDHFARADDDMAKAQKAGTLARNFQGYTTDNAAALIGLGASSIGALPQGYVQNCADVPSYRAAIESGRLPVARGIALTEDDRLRRHVIERLMCDLSVDLEAAANRFGRTAKVFSGSIERLAPLAADGIVTVRGTTVEIAPKWRALTRVVCAAFDTYLESGARRHALAV